MNTLSIDRAGIYLFYDPKGKISAHVMRSLRAFKPFITDLIFVSNGSLDPKSKIMLEQENLVTQIIERQNFGFDVWGYREGLMHLGLNTLDRYDEIILFNYTFFAPAFALEPMFHHFKEKPEIDFWGITEYKDNLYHFIQSYFIVTRKSLHSTADYREYWLNMPEITHIDESIELHEKRFTAHFAYKKKYKFEVFYKPLEKEDGNTTLVNLAPLLEAKVPILKYKAFDFDPTILQRRGGQGAAHNLKLAKEKSAYPYQEMLDYVIEQSNADTLSKNWLQLDVVDTNKVSHKNKKTKHHIFIQADTFSKKYFRSLQAIIDRLETYKLYICSKNDNVLEDIRSCALFDHDNLILKKRNENYNLAILNFQDILQKKIQNHDICYNLKTFEDEPEKYDFQDILFQHHIVVLFTDEVHNHFIQIDTPYSHLPIGIISGYKNSLSGQNSGTKTLHRRDFKEQKIPDLDRVDTNKLFSTKLWPWLGICAIKGSLANNQHFLNLILSANANIKRDYKSSTTSVEFCMPEFARQCKQTVMYLIPKSGAARLAFKENLIEKELRKKINDNKKTMKALIRNNNGICKNLLIFFELYDKARRASKQLHRHIRKKL